MERCYDVPDDADLAVATSETNERREVLWVIESPRN